MATEEPICPSDGHCGQRSVPANPTNCNHGQAVAVPSGNGATVTFGWDGMRRETSRTLPSGLAINHEYGLGQGPGASWRKVAKGISPNSRWTKTVFDGFGRTLEAISRYKVGSTEPAVSKVVAEHTHCACSSIGKVKQTSMPFAANAGPAHWTTYEYL